jgi:hemerythrin
MGPQAGGLRTWRRTGDAAMALLQWDDKFDVGLPRVDAQHRRLFELFNQLDDARENGRADDVLQHLLDELLAYTRTHFADEEIFMRATAHPGYARHKVEHEKLLAQVQAFQVQLAAGATTLSDEVMSFLVDWLLDHIQGLDQELKTPAAKTPSS